MRFLDANIFIYAFYKPKREFTQKEQWMKEQAKRIINDISLGKEEVLTTIIHLSEVVNILKHGMRAEELARFTISLFMLNNIRIRGVTKEEYFAAAELAEELKLDPNDALAVDVMRANNIKEIYSFDTDFDKISGISRLPKY
ncbi:MAG: type II toxin-antitoxin system VapC family toxin [Candidatus Bathyarchaeia archaeon]|nr:type II toxin-antitoxin system VapC family toxin [Candidatus Bathyarchaeota archaeon]